MPTSSRTQPILQFDASGLLNEGKNPLAELTIAMKSIQTGETVLLESDFLPQPLIDTFQKQGHLVQTETKGEKYRIFITKQH